MSPDSSDPKKTHHTGGISGAGICFETNLEQTKAFGKKLPGHNIIGLGGISTREHVDLYLQAGATSIQICSAYLINKDSNIFKNIRK